MQSGIGDTIKNLILKNLESASPEPCKLENLGKSITSRYLVESPMSSLKHMNSLKLDIKKVKLIQKKPDEMNLREILTTTDRYAKKKIKITKVKFQKPEKVKIVNFETKNAKKLPRLKLKILEKEPELRSSSTAASTRYHIPIIHKDTAGYQEFYSDRIK